MSLVVVYIMQYVGNRAQTTRGMEVTGPWLVCVVRVSIFDYSKAAFTRYQTNLDLV